jgi:hypothetical protein
VTTTRVETPSGESQVGVPASGVLSAWTAHDWRDGVHVGDLAALETLVVKTENSTYEIVVMAADTARVLVRGGAFFPVFTPARLAGSSLGGAFLKLHSVHLGFRLEFGTENGFIITSPVRSVARRSEPTDPADLM